MTTPPEQHDTLALTRPGYPMSTGTGVPTGYGTNVAPYPGQRWAMPTEVAWSHMPPFVTAAPAPVIRTNNAAVVGATLGSVSLFLSVVPLFGILAWLLAPIGLASSAVGLAVGISRQAGRVGAIYGLIASGIALLICCAWVLLLMSI